MSFREVTQPRPFTQYQEVDFLGVPLRPLTVAEFIRELIYAAGSDQEEPVFVTYLNAWCSNVAGSDTEYLSILRTADCVYADGQAVVWAGKRMGSSLPERVNAGDFAIEFCRAVEEAGRTIYLLGSEEGVAATAAETFRSAVPGVRIQGARSGYFGNDEAGVVSEIAQQAPDILIIGMGVPFQEKWAWANRHLFRARVIWCVGALFEYYSGTRARAPVWVRRIGMEWAFRLVLEPSRLWRRYVIGNARFIARVLRHHR